MQTKMSNMSLNSIQESLFKKIEHIDDIVKKRNGQFTINKFQSLFDVTRTEPIYHHPRRTSNEMQEIIQPSITRISIKLNQNS